jgi:hypothetical protein
MKDPSGFGPCVEYAPSAMIGISTSTSSGNIGAGTFARSRGTTSLVGGQLMGPT